ncbi:hypothetical protein RHGRI_021389 [Rhododendron griersonianum]|uniref:HAT C-terminal dimerisation domain-containing protein n=1 Tax=Rhododendron griersonianum TaxID=479676 RepID=A0AAV6JQV8_9ERIC|nr:hypothetical protein RHGRI_021389 [Rhododendron griersonianum]
MGFHFSVEFCVQVMDSASGDEVEAVIHGGDTPTVPRKSTKRKAKANAKAKPPKAQKQGTGRPESVAWDHFDKIEAKDTADGIQRAMKQKVKNCLIRLFEDYAKHDKNSVEVPNVCLASAMTIDDDFDDPHKALASQFSSYMEQQYSISSKSEVDKYLAESCEAEDDDSKFDILMWWKNNSVRFNVLSQVARDVLAFPV